jgi:hypothetical protein
VALPGLPKLDPAAIMAAANQQAKGITDPILAQINAQYQRERDAAIARQQQMAAATDQAYASARDPLANVYNSAIQQGTELENAVSNRLKGVGDSRSSDFAARLAQMGAPQTGAAQELATKYKGADAAGFAKGMNDVGRLVSRGAEARSWLEKAPGLARQQSQAELATALQEMFSDYSDDTGELMANLPGQVQSIYDKLYGTASDERNDQNANAWAQVKFIQEQIAANQEAKVVAATLNDKKAARAAAAEDKRLNRELQRWKAQLQADTSTANDNPPTPTTKVMGNKTYQWNGSTWVPIGPAPAGTGDEDETVDTPGSAKRGRVVNAINNELFVKGQKRQWVTAAYNWNIVTTRINGVMRNQGVDPNSPLGIQLRKNAFTKLGVTTGPKGNPTMGPKGRSGSDRPRN